jgi:hypothetical protein
MAKDSYKDGMLSIMIALRAWAKFLPTDTAERRNSTTAIF